ncbi:cytochrome c [Hymenobacter koreensis]|uniref:Cytochrome c domain-containing protein n=1 Tax=Hymenobacter koreensis TaxID=1084523 RepID=A0ABP8J2L0_9BACT
MQKALLSTVTKVISGASLGLLVLVSACSYSNGGDPAPCNDPTPVTYAGVISPIFDTNCRSCHGAGVYQTLGGGNDYSSYQAIKNQSARLILGCISHEAGYNPMPKGGAKISACDIARIKSWIDAGQPNN